MNHELQEDCIWEFEGDYWSTGCGNNHVFLDGNPVDNSYKYCPYCGSEIYMLNVEVCNE